MAWLLRLFYCLVRLYIIREDNQCHSPINKNKWTEKYDTVSCSKRCKEKQEWDQKHDNSVNQIQPPIFISRCHRKCRNNIAKSLKQKYKSEKIRKSQFAQCQIADQQKSDKYIEYSSSKPPAPSLSSLFYISRNP